MRTQEWLIAYRPTGVAWNNQAGWYYGTTDPIHKCLTSAAVGPFGTAQEACMDLTRAFVTADAFGPVEDRKDEE